MTHHQILRPLAKSKGNTLVEYGMLGTIVLGATIVVLSMFGSDLNTLFGGLKSEAKTSGDTATSWNSSHAADAAAAKASALSNQIGNALLNGSRNSATIEVTAANGTTLQGVLAKAYKAIFKTPAASLTDSQILAMERDMSNSTFAIADLEKQMQDILSYAGSDPAKFMKTNLNFNGLSTPPITLAIGLQNEAEKLKQMQAQLDASSASAEDKAKLAALVLKVSGDAAVIYSKSQALQSQYQASVAQQQIATANAAIQTANTTTDTTTKAEKVAEANQAMATANVAQAVANVSAAAASTAAQTAAASGVSTAQDPATTVANATKSADVMCQTGNGVIRPSSCDN